MSFYSLRFRQYNPSKLTASHFLSMAVLCCLLLTATTESTAQELPSVAVEQVIASPVTPILSLTGNVHSRALLSVTAGLDAQLSWVAEAGTRVEQGDDVVVFDAEPLRLQQEEQKALIARDQVQLSYLNRELKRMEKLHQRKNVSQDQLEEVQSRRDLAQQDIAVAKTRLAIIEERLSRTRLLSPFTGVVVAREHREGEDVSRGDVLMQLLQLDPLELRLFVPVKHLPSLLVGQTVAVFREHAQTEKTDARIRSIIPNADSRSQTIEVRIDLAQHQSRPWVPGELLRTQMKLKTPADQVAVPRDAILIRSDGTYVVTVDLENSAQRVKVRVGQAQGQWINVSVERGQLKAGNRVAVRGAERLTQGQKVRIVDRS